MVANGRAGRGSYDVAICGAGLAGLTLARQLKLSMPDLEVVLFDRLTRPLPEAGFKVGESTVETGAIYLAETLRLASYLEDRHLPKLGLRYFFGDPLGPFEKRPEFGLSEFPAVTSYQIDRGRFENDLREMVCDAGVELVEGCFVQGFQIEGDRRHRVIYRPARGRGTVSVRCRWVVDALGRRRLLQRQLGLCRPPRETRPVRSRHNAVWFRIPGRIDVADLVPGSAESWHQRVPGGTRYYSTNHLMGDGYWVWLIPLPSDVTSIGIVTLEDLHPFASYNVIERAQRWMRTHEPALARRIDGCEFLDFRRLGDYTHTSRQVFSEDRWACVGEAGVFADPFYSPGTDLIGFANRLTGELIAADLDGRLSADFVARANAFFLALNDGVTHTIQSGYPFFGHPMAMAGKLIWDFVAGWALTSPLMFSGAFLDIGLADKIGSITARFLPLSHRVQTFFREWSTKASRGSFTFIDYLAIPFVRELRLRNLVVDLSPEDLLANARQNMATLEELAQALFLLALEDTLPEELKRFPQPTWLNAWAISLDPSRWEVDGLFRPASERRSLAGLLDDVRSLFRFEPGRGSFEPGRESTVTAGAAGLLKHGPASP